LQQLSLELLQAYEAGNLDAFGLHVYGMVLSSGRSTLVLPPNTPSAQSVLIQSILQFPYNWSAWLDLSALVVSSSEQGDNVEGDIEELLQPTLASHFMYHFFCAHLQAERQSHADAIVVYERLMDPSLFAASPYLLGQHAVCSYHMQDFATAKTLMQDLHNHMPYRLDNMEVFSNILYVQEDSVALSQLAHVAVQVDKYRAETCCIVGNYYSLKQQRAKAIQYFQRALKMDRTFTSAWTLMGHEYVEWKQTANAMEAYRRAVQISPTDFRAWYGLGQTYELLNMNLYALYYYKQAAQLRPYDTRMWCAVGSTYAQLQRTDDAILAFERAVEQNDSDGVATQKLAALYSQEGRNEDAAKCYMRHLELVRTLSSVAQKALTLISHGSARLFFSVINLRMYMAQKKYIAWRPCCWGLWSSRPKLRRFSTWPFTTAKTRIMRRLQFSALVCSITPVPNESKPKQCFGSSNRERPAVLLRLDLSCTRVRKARWRKHLNFHHKYDVS
jgi:anaphase-promoting complex subunit 8